MEYKVYKVRWIILFGIAVCGLMRGYFPSMFAFINDVLALYLGVSPSQADALIFVENAVAIFVCMATAIIGDKMGVRFLSLATSILLAVCITTAIAAITSRDLYPLMLCSRAISGIPAAFLYILPPIFANAWFPPGQIATVTVTPLIVMCMGGLTAPIVISNILPKLELQNNTNDTVEDYDFDWMQKVFIGNNLIFLTLAVISSGIFCAFARNKPPSPPSRAQAELTRKLIRNDQRSALQKKFGKFKQILSDRSFWIICMVNFLSSSTMPFTVYLLPSVVNAAIPGIDPVIVGYLASSGIVISAMGTFAAGKVLDKFGSFRRFCLSGLLLCTGCSIAIYFGLLLKNIVMLFIFFDSLGGFRLFSYTSMIELLLEVTYPMDRIITTSIFFAFYNASAFVWTPIHRCIFNIYGPQHVTWIVAGNNLVSALILLLLNQKYKRSAANIAKPVDDLTLNMLEEKD